MKTVDSWNECAAEWNIGAFDAPEFFSVAHSFYWLIMKTKQKHELVFQNNS